MIYGSRGQISPCLLIAPAKSQEKTDGAVVQAGIIILFILLGGPFRFPQIGPGLCQLISHNRFIHCLILILIEQTKAVL